MPGIDLLVSDRQGYFDEWEKSKTKAAPLKVSDILAQMWFDRALFSSVKFQI